METTPQWRERFTRSQIIATRVAPADRTAGLVTVIDGKGPKLHAWDVPAGATRPVATPSANLFAHCWLGHDGRYAYVLADDHGNELGHLTAVDLRESGDPVDLTPELRALLTADGEPAGVFSDGPGSSVEANLFSPRPGDPTVAVTTDRSGVRRPALWRIDHDTRRSLDVGDLPGDVLPIDWSDDGRFLLLCHLWRTVQQLLRYDLEADRIEPLDLPAGSYVDNIVRTSHFGPDGAVLAATDTFATTLTVHRHRPGGPTEVALASEAAPPGTPARSVDLPSSDGTLVQGWLATPEPPGPHPTVIHVHGGPHWVEQDSYNPYAQMWLDDGYAYLGLNYRGSTTFGKAYQEQIWGDVGHWEVEDMAAARQWLVETGVADPDRVLVTGGSYGGFLTLHALGARPELWAGGIAEVAIADWRLVYEEANPAIRKAVASWHGGTPEQVPERYQASSTMTHLPRLAAPLLIRQARHDSRAAARQMEVYEREAKRLGKPVTVLWDEGGHALLDDPLAYLERVLEFAAGCVASPG